MNIEELFDKELSYIKDENIRKSLIELLKILPKLRMLQLEYIS